MPEVRAPLINCKLIEIHEIVLQFMFLSRVTEATDVLVFIYLMY